MQIRIWPNTNATPVDKLADAELQFTEGPLEGMKLVGFSVWKSGRGLNVTFPARSYQVNGERRSYALLRTISEPGAEDGIRDLILKAYERFAREERPPQTAPAPRREPRYEYDETPAPRPRATGTSGRRAAPPAFPRSAERRFNNRHED